MCMLLPQKINLWQKSKPLFTTIDFSTSVHCSGGINGRRQLTTMSAIKSAIFLSAALQSMKNWYVKPRGERERIKLTKYLVNGAREQKSAFAWARGDTGKGVCPASYKTLTDKV